MHQPLIRGLTFWDYGIIGFYFLFIILIGWICRRISKDASDYFRGGGNMLWWVAGMSSMMAGISTWTFTGGAAKCYQDGLLLPVTYWLAAVSSLWLGLWVAPRFRRFRVVTAMEAVCRRFGTGTEQLYTWITLPLGLFIGAVGLNTLGVFMASSFHAHMPTTIIVVGIITTFMAMLGGQWAVAASSFVQGLIMFLIVFVVVFFSVNLPQIGGVTHLLSALPARHLNFDLGERVVLVWIWVGWQTMQAIIGPLDIRGSGNFVRVKDEKHARRMVLMMALPSILLLMPFWIQVPAMCAAVIFPNMHAVFPNLQHPDEAAWVAMSFKVLPQGLMGVMVCGMFSAAITTLDAGLNTNAGFFVRNVYARYIRPAAGPGEQVLTGKLVTILFGGLMIGLGLMINDLRTVNLFDFFQIFNAVVMPPMGVPMILGLVIKRTPAWSGWSTVLVGLAASLVAHATYSPQLIHHWVGGVGPLNPREVIDSEFVYIGVVTFSTSVLWFLGTTFFYRQSHVEHHQRVETLFADLATPVDRVREGNQDQDALQYRMIGQLSMILGGFMLLCILIPNPLRGRMAFLFIGGVSFSLGALLWAIYKRKMARRRVALAALATEVEVVTVQP